MKDNKIVFPKGFFTKLKQNVVSNKDNKDKDIPFKWSEEVLNGETKVKIVSNKKRLAK